jgi:N-acetylglutamate synthase-like GNAT family acetyltransferase
MLEAGARAGGLTHLYLLTETAKDFFLKRGYHVVPRAAAPTALQTTAEFKSLCPASAICMHKELV